MNKKKTKTLALIISIILACLILTVSLITISGVHFYQLVVKTSPFLDENGHALPGSIARFEKVKLGGVTQSILIRGKNLDNPILLALHGGPGNTDVFNYRTYNVELENHFTMVYWDQRGAGKSYSPLIPIESMTITQCVSDTHELVEYLRQKYDKDKIFLVGHSWGSELGLLTASQYPDLFYAFIGIGQVVDKYEAEKRSYQYVLDEAKKRNNKKALAELKKVDGYWENFNADSLLVQRKWLYKFNGVFLNPRDVFSLYLEAIMSDEMSIFDYIPYTLGVELNKALWGNLRNRNFIQNIPEVNLPIYFLSGRYDHNTPSSLTEKYYTMLKAPSKRLIWFERSAHYPIVEEPEKFNSTLIDIVLPETYPGIKISHTSTDSNVIQ